MKGHSTAASAHQHLAVIFSFALLTAAMYPPIDPYFTGFLNVSDMHTLYYELSGNKYGIPVLFQHGGPGSGTQPNDRCYFNPEKYHIILYDQRGAGKSSPKGSVDENTTWDLVGDMEKLRKHLNLDSWHLFGVSWGSTLSLAYSQMYPDRVKSLTFSGVSDASRSKNQFYYQYGTRHVYPDAWDQFANHIPENERGDLITDYHKRLFSGQELMRIDAAKHWAGWELSTFQLLFDPTIAAYANYTEFSLPFATIINHYVFHNSFLEEGQLFAKENIDKIRHIPCVVSQGRYDMVALMFTAWKLEKVWPEVQLHIVPNAGHGSHEPESEKVLVAAMDNVVLQY